MRRMLAITGSLLLLIGLIAPMAGAHDKQRDDVARTWSEASVAQAESESSDNMSHVANITYELRYGEPLPHGTDVEFARLRVPDSDGVLERVAGPERVATAAKVSQASHDAADTVVVARADDYADALAGTPLAVQEQAPLLLTSRHRLSAASADEIGRLGASSAILLGGPNALAPRVAEDLRDLGLDTERVAGPNRFATAAEIFERLPASTEVLVAEGEHADPSRGWPDALSAAGYSATSGKPILLVNAQRLPGETVDKLDDATDVTIVGGPGAVSEEVADGMREAARSVDRIAGETRYATSVAVAREALASGASSQTMWVATGRNFADGLVAGPAVGAMNGLLLLIDGQNLDGSPAAADFIEERAPSVDTLYLAGGPGAISKATADRLRGLMSAPQAGDSQPSDDGVTGDPAPSDNSAPSSAHSPEQASSPQPLPAGTREFAIAGSYSNGLHIIDVTDPQNPRLASVYDCGILQGDVQVFSRDGRTYATYTSENTTAVAIESQCVQDAVDRGQIEVSEDDKSQAYGTYVVDITDPYDPRSAGLIQVPEGSHNGTVHPSGDYFYNSDSALIDDVTPQIQIYRIADLDAIERVGELDLPVHLGLGTSSHDVTFSPDGSRGYSAALSTTVILDTTDAANPTIISEFRDESIETEHGIKPFTLTDADGSERDFIAVADEVIGALPGNICPGGGVHFYDITEDNEQDPLANKVGTFFIPEQRLAGPNPLTGDIVEDEFGESGTCTAHVMRVHANAPGGPKMTIAWYNAGVHVLDLSGLADAGVNPAGQPVSRIGNFRFENSDTWSFKTNRFEEDGSFYGFGNDIIRGFDVYRFEAGASAEGGEAEGIWLEPGEALRAAQAGEWPGWHE